MVVQSPRNIYRKITVSPKRKLYFIWWLPLILLVAALLAPLALGDNDHDEDDHDDDHDRWENSAAFVEKRGKISHWFVFRRADVDPVTNEFYRKECGACHFAFQPGLLPSASWEKIMAGLEDHFGDNAMLDETSRKEITAYLVQNAAEFGEGRKSYKIMRSLGTQVPLRITEVPYFKREHREVSGRFLKRKGIKTLVNCEACHTSASEGVYDDD